MINDETTMGGSPMRLTLIAKENIPKIWPAFQDWIVPVIEKHGNELSPATIYQELCNATNQLWIYGGERIHGWAITSISTYHTVKRLRFILMGGMDMKSWLRQIEDIEQWALKFGATEAEAWVRPGLRKQLGAFGYAAKYEVVTKQLEKRVIS